MRKFKSRWSYPFELSSKAWDDTCEELQTYWLELRDDFKMSKVSRIEVTFPDDSILEQLVNVVGPNEESLIRIAIDEGLSETVIMHLLEADKNGERLYTERILLDLLQKYPLQQEWMDRYLSEPTLDLITDPTVNGATEVSSQCFPYIANSICCSEKLQRTANREIVSSNVLVCLFLQFYCKIALVVCCIVASIDFLLIEWDTGPATKHDTKHGENKYAMAAIFIVALYSLFQFLQYLSTGLDYFFNKWNAVDHITILMVLGVSILSLSENESASKILTWNNNILLVITGCIVCTNMILFLRQTFLPVATFVNGTINIIETLGPFFIVLMMIINMIVYMYYVSRFDDNWKPEGPCNDENSTDTGFCSYNDTLKYVFGFLMDGPDAIVDWLDYFCGIVLVIIFLNVIIAIVSSAWDEATKTNYMRRAFWNYRVQYFAEIWYARKLYFKLHSKRPVNVPKMATVKSFSYYGEQHNSKREWKTLLRFIITLFARSMQFILGLLTFGYFLPMSVRTNILCYSIEIEMKDGIQSLPGSNRQKENTTLVKAMVGMKKDIAQLKKMNVEQQQSNMKEFASLMKKVMEIKEMLVNSKNES